MVRFGAETEIVSRFGEEMNDQLGGEVVEKFTFEQQSTNVIEMLDFTSRYVVDSTFQLLSYLGTSPNKAHIVMKSY